MSFTHRSDPDRDEGRPELKRFKEFGGTWPAYKRYLAKNGVEVGDDAPDNQPLSRAASAVVPWNGKMWHQLEQKHLSALADHFRGLDPQRAENYRLFLIHHAGAPRDLFQQLGLALEVQA